MRHDKQRVQLELLLLLVENRQYSVDLLCERTGLQKRNLYYYLNVFKAEEFGLEKHGDYYSIPRSCKYISTLCDIVKFTEDEAVTLKNLLDGADENIIQVHTIRQKLERFYDLRILENTPLRKRQAKIVHNLYNAIRDEKMVKLIDYSSPHSQTISTRLVEPYLLMNGSRDVRAYEVESGQNKTFRISRMARVEVLDTTWKNAREHRRLYSDFFNFSSEELIPVTLLLDQLSYNVLVEEYPRAEQDITVELDGWCLKTQVCSMLGIGRFVLGLYDHIKVIDSPELEQYLSEKLKSFTSTPTPQSLTPNL